jgi:hypothetical protein
MAMHRLRDTDRNLVVDDPNELVLENEVLRGRAGFQGIERVISGLRPGDDGGSEADGDPDTHFE